MHFNNIILIDNQSLNDNVLNATSQDVRDLYRVYEKDFLLFGYSFTFRGKTFPEEKNKDLVHLI